MKSLPAPIRMDELIHRFFGAGSPFFHSFLEQISPLIPMWWNKNSDLWKKLFPSFVAGIEVNGSPLEIMERYIYLTEIMNILFSQLTATIQSSLSFHDIIPLSLHPLLQLPHDQKLLPDFPSIFNNPSQVLLESIEGDLFGPLFQEILSLPHREEKGMFFTPPPLTNFVIQRLFETFTQMDKTPLKFAKNFLDPTCGTGSFIFRLYWYLFEQYPTEIEESLSTQHLQIWGMDENPFALLACVVNVAIFMLIHKISLPIIIKICHQVMCRDLFDFALQIVQTQFQPNENEHPVFDIILGNLPWNVFNNIQDPTLKNRLILLGKEMDLTMTWKNRSNLEIATLLFYVAQITLLASEGWIAVLLPASILTGTQHAKFRRFRGLTNIKVFYLTPDYFPIHCILFLAQKCMNSDLLNKFSPHDGVLAIPPLPSPFSPPILDTYRYHFLKDRMTWELKEHHLETPTHISTFRDTPLVGKFGVYSISTTDSKEILPISKSPYHNRVLRGVDVTPRQLLFVRIETNESETKHDPGLVKILPLLHSSRSTHSTTWQSIRFPPTLIESSMLHPILKSTLVVPYTHRSPELAFLPIALQDHQYVVLLPEELPPYARAHFFHISTLYSSNRAPTTKNTTLIASLTYGSKLFAPEMCAPLKIVYPVGGSYCKATLIRDPAIFIDVTLYYLAPHSEAEAYYLLAWLNSRLLQQNLHRVCTIGANGSIRVIHLAPWLFPLPLFSETPLSLQIAAIGRELEQYVKNLYHSYPSIPSLIRIYSQLTKDIEYQSLLDRLDTVFFQLFKEIG